jgi:hypothetical protein
MNKNLPVRAPISPKSSETDQSKESGPHSVSKPAAPPEQPPAEPISRSEKAKAAREMRKKIWLEQAAHPKIEFSMKKAKATESKIDVVLHDYEVSQNVEYAANSKYTLSEDMIDVYTDLRYKPLLKFFQITEGDLADLGPDAKKIDLWRYVCNKERPKSNENWVANMSYLRGLIAGSEPLEKEVKDMKKELGNITKMLSFVKDQMQTKQIAEGQYKSMHEIQRQTLKVATHTNQTCCGFGGMLGGIFTAIKQSAEQQGLNVMGDFATPPFPPPPAYKFYEPLPEINHDGLESRRDLARVHEPTQSEEPESDPPEEPRQRKPRKKTYAKPDPGSIESDIADLQNNEVIDEVISKAEKTQMDIKREEGIKMMLDDFPWIGRKRAYNRYNTQFKDKKTLDEVEENWEDAMVHMKKDIIDWELKHPPRYDWSKTPYDEDVWCVTEADYKRFIRWSKKMSPPEADHYYKFNEDEVVEAYKQWLDNELRERDGSHVLELDRSTLYLIQKLAHDKHIDSEFGEALHKQIETRKEQRTTDIIRTMYQHPEMTRYQAALQVDEESKRAKIKENVKQMNQQRPQLAVANCHAQNK